MYFRNKRSFLWRSSSFLSICSVKQLAKDEAHRFPRASRILTRDLYVDDLLTGANSLEKVYKIRYEIIDLLKCAGFVIRQWASNHSHALDNIQEKVLNSENVVEQKIISITLGVTWNSHQDNFIYSSKSFKPAIKFTKRHELSEVAKIFNPLELLGPIIFLAKTMMQECWKLKCKWNDSLPEKFFSFFKIFPSSKN